MTSRAVSASWLQREPTSGNEEEPQQEGVNYVFSETIGEGTYGSVLRAAWLSHPAAALVRQSVQEGSQTYFHLLGDLPRDALVAVKRMKSSSQAEFAFLMREIAALQRVRAVQDQYRSALQRYGPTHPRVRALQGSQYCLRLLEVEERASRFPNIVTELCILTLHDLIYSNPHTCDTNRPREERRSRPLPLCCVTTFTKQILEALAFLHDGLRMVHRDLKPANIMLQAVPRVPAPRPNPHTTPAAAPAASTDALFPADEEWTVLSTQGPASPELDFRGSDTTFTSPPHRDPASPATGSRRSQPRLDSPTTESWRMASPPTVEPVVHCRLCGATPFPHDPFATPSDAPLPPELDDLLAVLRSGDMILQVRVGDFGSCCQTGPQPLTSSHLRSTAASAAVPGPEEEDDDNAPLLPLGRFPACFAKECDRVVDTRLPTHASTSVRFADPEVVIPAPPTDQTYPMALPPVRMPRVTHGWTTMAYRSPEDMLSDQREGVDHNAKELHFSMVRLGPSIDVWSIGCIFVEMLIGEMCFTHCDGAQQWPFLSAIFAVTGCPLKDRAEECLQSGCSDSYCSSTRCWPGVGALMAERRAALAPSERHRHLREACQAFDSHGGLELFGHNPGRGVHAIERGGGVSLAERIAALDRALFWKRYGVDIPRLGTAIGVSPRSSPSADLLARLMLLDPSRRITASEALQHQLVVFTTNPSLTPL